MGKSISLFPIFWLPSSSILLHQLRQPYRTKLFHLSYRFHASLTCWEPMRSRLKWLHNLPMGRLFQSQFLGSLSECRSFQGNGLRKRLHKCILRTWRQADNFPSSHHEYFLSPSENLGRFLHFFTFIYLCFLKLFCFSLSLWQLIQCTWCCHHKHCKQAQSSHRLVGYRGKVLNQRT